MFVAEHERVIVVPRGDQIRPTVPFQIECGQSLTVAWHNESAFAHRHGNKATSAISTKKLAEASIHMSCLRNGRVGILHGADIRQAIAVKIPGHQSVDRCDLRQPRQSRKTIGPVWLT